MTHRKQNIQVTFFYLLVKPSVGGYKIFYFQCFCQAEVDLLTGEFKILIFDTSIKKLLKSCLIKGFLYLLRDLVQEQKSHLPK